MRSPLLRFQTPTTPRRVVGFFGFGGPASCLATQITRPTLDQSILLKPILSAVDEFTLLLGNREMQVTGITSHLRELCIIQDFCGKEVVERAVRFPNWAPLLSRFMLAHNTLHLTLYTGLGMGKS